MPETHPPHFCGDPRPPYAGEAGPLSQSMSGTVVQLRSVSPCMVGCVVLAAVRAGSRLCLGRLSGEAVFLCCSCALSPVTALFCLRACSVSTSIIVLITPQLVNYELEEKEFPFQLLVTILEFVLNALVFI